MVYKKQWKNDELLPFVGVGWEHLQSNTYYGICNNIYSKSIDSSSLKGAIGEYRTRQGFKQDAAWWLLWLNGPYNFADSNQLIAILPDQMQSAAE